MTPEALAASGFLRLVNGMICAPEAPTCGEKSFDYFVVCRTLSHAVVGVQRIIDADTNPHTLVQLLIKPLIAGAKCES